MSKATYIVLLLLFLSAFGASPPSATGTDPGFDTLQLEGFDRGKIQQIGEDQVSIDQPEIEIYRAYYVNTSDQNPEYANVSFIVNKTWVDKAKSQDQDIFILSGPYLELHNVEIASSDDHYIVYSSNKMKIQKGKLILAKHENIWSYVDFKTDSEKCGPFLDPEENLTKVKDCRYSDGSMVSSVIAYSSSLGSPAISFFSTEFGAAILGIVLVVLSYFQLKKHSISKRLDTNLKQIYSERLDHTFSGKELQIMLLTIVTAAFLLRILAISPRTLWWDELFSWWTLQLDLSNYFKVILQDVNFPLYYIILRGWSYLTGSSEFLLRLLSVFFSTVSVYYVFLIGKIWNPKAAIYSSSLAAFSWFHIYYAPEVRFYALLSMLSVMSIYYFVKLINNSNKLNTRAYIISTLLLLYTHPFGIFIFAAQSVLLLLFYIDSNLPEKAYSSYKKIIVGLIPLIPIAGIQFLPIGDPYWGWIESPTLQEIISVLTKFSGNTTLLVFFLVLLLASLYGFRRNLRREDDSLTLLLWLCLGFSLILPWVLSKIVFPVFIAKYMIGGAMAYYSLIGLGLSKIPDLSTQIIIFTGILAISVPLITGNVYEINPHEPWNQTVHDIESNYTEGDTVIYNGHFSRFAFEKYGEKQLNMTSIPQKHVYDSRDDYIVASSERPQVKESDIAKIEPRINHSNRIWLLLSHERGKIDSLIRKLNSTFSASKTRDYGGIEVILFSERNE